MLENGDSDTGADSDHDMKMWLTRRRVGKDNDGFTYANLIWLPAPRTGEITVPVR